MIIQGTVTGEVAIHRYLENSLKVLRSNEITLASCFT